jgi:tetratricopeptide (TPR) repeat protein
MEESFYHRGHKGSTSLLLLLLLILWGCAAAPTPPREQIQPPYRRIQESIEAGNPQNALQLYRDYLHSHPDQQVDRLLLARLLLSAGHAAEARAELESLVDESGATTEVLLTLAHLERVTGNPERQRDVLERALEIDRDNPAVLEALGTLHLEAEAIEEAAALFRRALEIDPLDAQALHGLGVVLLNQGEYEEALNILDRAVEADPGSALHFSDRARARAALGDPDGAVQDLSRAIALDPEFYWNYIDRGRHLLQMRQLREAEADFSRAIQIDPEIFLPYVYRAGIYDRLDQRGEAVADYRRVVELNPEYFFAYAPLGVLCYLEENWESAAGAFQQAYHYEPDQPSYALLAALSWMQLGQDQRARKYLEEQLGEFPEDAWPTLIARYFLNPALEGRTIDATGRIQNKLDRARALFFIASRLLQEQRIETALRYLLLVRDIERPDLPEKKIAEQLLRNFGYRD